MPPSSNRQSWIGVWSAAPTPFTEKMQLDEPSIKRMVAHHFRLGVKGLFLAGTNGEGPWMTDEQRERLVSLVVRYGRGRIPIAVQVTDNSAARILQNIASAKANGANIAVIAPPFFGHPGAREMVLHIYLDSIRSSPLPVGIYDRGTHSPVPVPNRMLAAIYAERNVVLIKDSSRDPERRKIALSARANRPSLVLLNGDEFACVDYLKAGYDGLLLGGGVFNAFLAQRLMEAAAAGDWRRAERLQARMNRAMWAVYGGKRITCWLSGEKQLLVEMGLFRSRKNYPRFPLTTTCRRNIRRVLRTERDWLLPGTTKIAGPTP